MMKKALIFENKVVDVSNSIFDTSPSMSWMDCPDECEAGWSVYNNTLVEKTPDEISQQTQIELDSITKHVKTYRDEKAIEFPYKTTVMRLTDGARADISAVYFAVTLDTSITDEAVVMTWQETGYDDLPITAGDLRTDGLTFMNHRQKCFTVAGIIAENHEQEPYGSKEALEQAFDVAYDNN